MAEIIIMLVVLVIVFCIALIPSWLLLLAYNYLVEVSGHATAMVPVTFWTVVCVAFIIGLLYRIFGRDK